MITYEYKAVNTSGTTIKATVQADNEAAASRLIREQGLNIVELKEASSGFSFGFGNRISTKDKILFARQMSTLINAGLPLVQSLRNVQSQTANKNMVSVIGQIVSDVEAGKALSQALSNHPRVFSQVFISLIAAGEVSGTLDKALERLAFQQEKDAEIISKVRGAMIYPIIVLVVMMGVVGFMVIVVVPQVSEMFKSFQAGSLPIQTRFLIWLSDSIRERWYILIAIVAILGFGATKWARTFGGKNFIDNVKIKMPPLKSLFMKVYMARFARTGTTLVASGVPLIQMLEIVSKSINNVHIEESMLKAIEQVKGGKALSASIANDPNFLPLVPSMLQIGEQSGAIEDMLAKIAEYYEKEVDTAIKNISTIIEPTLMVVLGGVAILIVTAILLPIYSLANKVS